MTEPSTFDVAIVGGGVIGLVIAWRAAQRGLRVMLADPDPAGGAARVAAGMLAPVSEVTYTEEPLLRLGLASRALYGDFVAELEDATGQVLGYRTEGTIQVAYDADDMAVLSDLLAFRLRLGLAGERLTARQCRELEPMLAPSVRGGTLAPGDGSIDPRRLSRALLVAAERAGVAVVRDAVTEVSLSGDAVTGVLLGGGQPAAAPWVVLAAGYQSARVGGLPPAALPPVRPVKGQTIRLRAAPGFIGRSVRGLVQGGSVYLVPRTDGEIVVGATQEELGEDRRVTAGGVWELLRDARELLPGITELELAETGAGLRPGSPDNAPLLGAAGLPGLLVATGHFRNGILLTPITGEVIASLLTSGVLPPVAAAFSPQRFGAGGGGGPTAGPRPADGRVAG